MVERYILFWPLFRAYHLRETGLSSYMSENTAYNKAMAQFHILREIAQSWTSGNEPAIIAEAALRSSARLLGMSAARLILWDDDGRAVLTSGYFETDEDKRRLDDLENDLFSSLRKNNNLISAYLSFGGEKPVTGFTLPLKSKRKILGAVIGIQPGTGSLVREDEFLEALGAALSVSLVASGLGEPIEDMDKRISKERIKAIIETSTTLNHEINNPLTAVLGNIQLLLMRRSELDRDLIKKLETVEESAMRIRTVMQKLMNLTRDSVTDYADGLKMIDLSDEDNNSS